ncbi:MAG TPA: nucleoside hydrolase [Terriglobales bacterium]|nr:nucleoside hydrolase [Terriglobales bacterium]
MKKRTLNISACLIVVLSLLGFAGAQPAPKKIIIDTDPGTDDALAILLALNSPEVQVEAITVVPGNVTAEMGLANALKLTTLANRCDIPVAGGAQHPLAQKLITAEFWHGKNGLADIDLPTRCHADPRFGPDLIISLVHKYPHQITLVPVGPLTNIALALSKDPSIVPLVKEVILMGGSVSGGNVNAAAEANIYNDPEAAQIVFNAGFSSLTMVGLDVGNKTLFGEKQIEQLQAAPGPVSNFVAQVGKFLLDLSRRFGFDGSPMYDPLAMGVTLDRTLVATQDMRVDVETRGQFTRGETVANRANQVERNVLHGDHYIIEGVDRVAPNAKVCVDVQAQRFLDLLVSRIKGK